MNDEANAWHRYLEHAEPVAGGDINRCYRLHTPQGEFFLKVNEAGDFPSMLEKEARGLQALQDAASGLIVPRTIETGVRVGKQFLLMEWLQPGNATESKWHSLGEGLARLHLKQGASYGWDEDNYIGSLLQWNNRSTTWSEFFTTCRLEPLVKKLFDRGDLDNKSLDGLENAARQWASIFPEEKPGLLHGDLWQGNVMMTGEGAAIFDPAVYFGHREMDLGMTQLFGGFHPAFYVAYNALYPLERNWKRRLPYSQLYPLLVHAVLFGGGYIHRSREILEDFL